MKTDKELLELSVIALLHILSASRNNEISKSHRLNVIEGRAKRMIEFIKKHQDEKGGH
jgi:hypothetical protein